MFNFARADLIEIVGHGNLPRQKSEAATLPRTGRIEGDHFDERLARLGDNEPFSERGSIDEPRQVGLCFVDVHNFHDVCFSGLSFVSLAQIRNRPNGQHAISHRTIENGELALTGSDTDPIIRPRDEQLLYR